jgi:predicted HTH transcriptional regulator
MVEIMNGLNAYLLKRIGEGEHLKQDFKYCINDSRKIAKTLVAFANTAGGRLLIGVKDNGKIVGVSSDEEYYMVESAAKLYSNPPVDFYVNQLRYEGKTVLDVYVNPGTLKPYLAKDENGKWLAYIRVEDENIIAHPIQVEVWKKQYSAEGIHLTYSVDEQFIIAFLKEKGSFSFSEYFRAAGISRNIAEEILSNFIVLGIVKMEHSKEGTKFYLDENFDLNHYQLY